MALVQRRPCRGPGSSTVSSQGPCEARSLQLYPSSTQRLRLTHPGLCPSTQRLPGLRAGLRWCPTNASVRPRVPASTRALSSGEELRSSRRFSFKAEAALRKGGGDHASPPTPARPRQREDQRTCLVRPRLRCRPRRARCRRGLQPGQGPPVQRGSTAGHGEGGTVASRVHPRLQVGLLASVPKSPSPRPDPLLCPGPHGLQSSLSPSVWGSTWPGGARPAACALGQQEMPQGGQALEGKGPGVLSLWPTPQSPPGQRAHQHCQLWPCASRQSGQHRATRPTPRESSCHAWLGASHHSTPGARRPEARTLSRIQMKDVVTMAKMVPVGMDFWASLRSPERLDPAMIPAEADGKSDVTGSPAETCPRPPHGPGHDCLPGQG